MFISAFLQLKPPCCHLYSYVSSVDQMKVCGSHLPQPNHQQQQQQQQQHPLQQQQQQQAAPNTYVEAAAAAAYNHYPPYDSQFAAAHVGTHQVNLSCLFVVLF